MNILKLKNYINSNYIISEHLADDEIEGYMDDVIDDINERMQTVFPVFSEWASFVADYNQEHQTDPDFVALDPLVYSAIPDNYLRKVVGPGTALNFFTNDEEGEQVANKYYIQYERAITNMTRDYLVRVPELYQATDGGYVVMEGLTAAEKPIAEGIVIQHGNNIL